MSQLECAVRALIFMLCIYRTLQEPGEMEPANPNFIVGKPINMTCNLNLSNPIYKQDQYGAYDVYFKIDDKTVDSSHVTVLDKTHVNLRCPATSEMDIKWVACLLKRRDDDEFIASNCIYVGYEPKHTKLVNIIVFNWTRLTFSWKKDVNNLYETSVQSWWKYKNQPTFQECEVQKLRTDKTTQHGNCSVQLADNTPWNSTFIVQVNTENKVGNNTTRPVSFSIYEKVKPDAVSKVTVMSESPENIVLRWRSPFFYEKLIYNIAYTDEWDKIIQIKSFPIHESTNAAETVLDRLEPFTQYNVTIKCKSALGGYWSDSTTVTVRTSPSVPFDVPPVTSGGYHMTRTSTTTRNITLYWQHVPQRSLQGPIKNYRVRYVRNGQLMTVIVPGDIVNYTIENLNQQTEYNVFIDAATTVGFNSTAQVNVITIPSLLSAVTNEEMGVIVSAYDDYTVNVDLTTEADPGLFYTLFWCGQSNSRGRTCKTELQWRKLSNTIESYNLTLPKRYVEYQFGVAVERETGNQGIHWVECVYDSRRNAKSPEISDVSDVTSTSLKIWLRPPVCRYNKGRILSYRITWCAVSTDKDNDCAEGSHNRIMDASGAPVIEIENLKPDTVYRVEALSITDTGLESYNPTFKIKRTDATFGGLSPRVLLAVIMIPSLIVFFAVIVGVIAIYRFGCHIRKWFTAFSVDIAEIQAHQEEVGEVEQSDSIIAHQHPIYEPTDNAYAPVSELSIEDEYAYPCMSKVHGRERVNPDGASNVVDYSTGYNRCHYTLSDKIKRKIKTTRKRPPQFYMEQRKPDSKVVQRTEKKKETVQRTEKKKEAEKKKETELNDAKCQKECDKDMLCKNHKDESDDAAEKDSLLLSQISSDYAASWSDTYTNVHASFDSLNDVPEITNQPDGREERNDIPDGNDANNNNNVVTAPMALVIDESTSVNEELSDWDSGDDDDGDGYKERATEIQCVVEDEDSDEDDDSDNT